jgi:hypothetical protein
MPTSLGTGLASPARSRIAGLVRAVAGVFTAGSLLHCAPTQISPETPVLLLPIPGTASPTPPASGSAVRLWAAAPTSPRDRSATGAFTLVKSADNTRCLGRKDIAADAQGKLRAFAEKENLLVDGVLENEGHRRVSVEELADVDGDGENEAIVEDVFGGNFNRPLFVYLSNGGCFQEVFAALGNFVWPRKARHGRHHDLALVTMDTSCTQPTDRFRSHVATLQWSGSTGGYRQVRGVSCPCEGRGQKAPADCKLPP